MKDYRMLVSREAFSDDYLSTILRVDRLQGHEATDNQVTVKELAEHAGALARAFIRHFWPTW